MRSMTPRNTAADLRPLDRSAPGATARASGRSERLAAVPR